MKGEPGQEFVPVDLTVDTWSFLARAYNYYTVIVYKILDPGMNVYLSQLHLQNLKTITNNTVITKYRKIMMFLVAWEIPVRLSLHLLPTSSLSLRHSL